MKLLAVCALLCAMMALTTAADEGGSDEGKALPPQPGEHIAEKRWFHRRHFWRRSVWTRSGNRHYRYFPYQLTWAQAQKFCESKNANLASVRSLGEYQTIQSVIFRATHNYVPTWIGGTNAQETNYWFWIGGTPFRYANWCSGEPNNLWGREHCLHMNWTGFRCMNDIPCDFRYPFVCVRKRR